MGEEKETEPTKAMMKRADVALSERGVQLRSMDELQRFCRAAMVSGVFDADKDRNADQLMAIAVMKAQYGMELGLPPVAALRGVIVGDSGKLELSAGAMAALIQRTGRYRYRVREHTAEACRIEFFDGAESIGESTFTLEDARQAEVRLKTKNGYSTNWTKFPRNMLFARALSNGARWFCPEIFFGTAYAEGETAGVIPGDTDHEIEVPRQPAPQPQSRAPQAPTTSRPGQAEPPPAATSAPAGASDSEPPPHDDGDAGPPEDSETPWEHARNAAAVKAAEAELGARVEGVKPPPQPRPTNFWAHCKSLGLDKPVVDAMLVAEFGHAEFSRLNVTDKKRAAALATAEANRRKAQGAAIVLGAKGAA